MCGTKGDGHELATPLGPRRRGSPKIGGGGGGGLSLLGSTYQGPLIDGSYHVC